MRKSLFSWGYWRPQSNFNYFHPTFVNFFSLITFFIVAKTQHSQRAGKPGWDGFGGKRRRGAEEKNRSKLINT
jgi:hypothetical protein